MRTFARILVPVLTLINWGVTATYASLTSPAPAASVSIHRHQGSFRRGIHTVKRQIHNADYESGGAPPNAMPAPEAGAATTTSTGTALAPQSTDTSKDKPKASQTGKQRRQPLGSIFPPILVNGQVSEYAVPGLREAYNEDALRRGLGSKRRSGRARTNATRGMAPGAPAGTSAVKLDSDHIARAPKNIDGEWLKRRQEHIMGWPSIGVRSGLSAGHVILDARAPKEIRGGWWKRQGHAPELPVDTNDVVNALRLNSTHPAHTRKRRHATLGAPDAQGDSEHVKRWSQRDAKAMQAWNKLARGNVSG